ncbi:MAG: ADP-heptose synthase (EC / D-glycero-beta-D-manno-heptose 7-phosphate kinase [uncultured Sulfurovum sp.]|uniref:Bifunctional protein HldE n=1 Tax=uncultured Sulfurovum sp. TaxID=269237 RepID=A0A6S6T8G3_9BACT|nr:MAG: ADP-heptose synthase (EC / D-glycero-beta-D-manno-heptose 7-phosphate kinase [uncultured Sulfurovum sp.]
MDRIRKKRPNIAVIGDLMIDHYIWGSCERISPEAPVQVVNVSKESAVLGGAGNVINNLISLGSDVSIFSVIGNDANANELEELLSSIAKEKVTLIHEFNRRTTKKSRIIASNQQVIRYDDETVENISLSSEDALLQALKLNLSDFDVLLLSDYGKGVLTKSLTQKIITLAKDMNKLVLVDPKGHDYSKYFGATLLTPNKKEAVEATKIDIRDDESLSKALNQLKNSLDLDYSLITLSEDGIGLLDDDVKVIPTVAREVFDVTGAGDTVLASLGIAMASGFSIVEACEFANKAAAVVVAKVGSATVTLNEIEEYEHSLNQGKSESKIKNFEQIERIAKRLKEQGRKIIFTNGCFDILHRGHATYLQQAKELGDILVLGLNSDESITRLKGKDRPINQLEDRAFLIGALESIDFVVPFSEDTPYELIKLVKPNILVKGADYEGKEVIGSDIVDEVKLISFVEGKSTTAMICKINGEG